ncbi:MAG: cupredoxin domain-containing protein [Patescibacteria group bacterium]
MKNKEIIIGIAVALILGAGLWFYNQSKIQAPEQEIGLSPEPVPTEQVGQEKTFEITAKRWEFNPNRIEVNQGDLVILKLKSLDVEHGLAIPEFGVNETFTAGEEKVVMFRADKTGVFPFFCSVYCGPGHSEMRGELIVR